MSTNTFNDTSQNYSCWRCGASVPSGCTHHCPTGALPSLRVVTPSVIEVQRVEWTQQRIGGPCRYQMRQRSRWVEWNPCRDADERQPDWQGSSGGLGHV